MSPTNITRDSRSSAGQTKEARTSGNKSSPTPTHSQYPETPRCHQSPIQESPEIVAIFPQASFPFQRLSQLASPSEPRIASFDIQNFPLHLDTSQRLDSLPSIVIPQSIKIPQYVSGSLPSLPTSRDGHPVSSPHHHISLPSGLTSQVT
ncbi:hypothetical protein PCASD_08417 [Puccinia coronata f. sp. avenae]|uniref:Uncharacterized protein n=1 Tax=Puccinia coronata f. sp. avenae TaxID=200324 RepID=A0A2N5UMK4_9BASI|nr:hypothetical protein PCASD_08417 [Puccinia coronata f. sp. avenae]